MKNEIKYVDGYVLTVRHDKLSAYKKMAKLGKEFWMKHGALDYCECVIDDDNKAKWGKSFTKLAKAREGDLIIFAFITFKNKAHRNKVNKDVMSDPGMSPDNYDGKEMPFEMKNMAYGGFKVLV